MARLTIGQFKFAQVPETRRRAYGSYESRLAVNVPILDKAADIRRRMAALYGYDTWADYVLEAKMVGSGRKVDEASLSRPSVCAIAD